MKILLDECLPRKLADLLVGHEVKTVTQAGWTGIKNGELLKNARGKFGVFLTIDKHMAAQQNLSSLQIGILIIRTKSNELEHLRGLVPKILEILSEGPFKGVRYVGP